MDKTAYVLIGVVLGVLLNAVKEWWFQKDMNKKGLEYLAIRISCILDTFVDGCADVVADDGQSGQDERASIQAEIPNFDPLSVEVEWKTLPAEIMYEVLSFPNQIEAANHKISNEFEYVAWPPDYEEGFQERQLQYAILGLKAHSLASKLRNIGNLALWHQEEWSPVPFMKEKVNEIEKVQKEHSTRNQALMQNMDTSA